MPNQKPKRISSQQYWILSAMMLATFMLNIEITAINLIITPLAHSLHIALGNTQWLIICYLLGLAIFITAAGKLGDMFGHQQIFKIGLICFIFASLLGGISNSLWMLLTARLLQGFGCALMYPNIMAISINAFSESKHGMVIGLISSVIGLGIAAGAPLGGLLVSVASWRWVFLVNVPVSLFVLAIAYYYFPKPRPSQIKNNKFDYYGFVLLALTIITLICAIENAKAQHSQLIWIISLFIISAVCASIFIYYENRQSNPLIATKLLQNPVLAMALTTRFLGNFTFYIVLFLFGLYFQQALGYSSLMSSLLFLPLTLCLGILSPLAGFIIDKAGSKKPTLLGLLLFIVAYYGFMHFTSHTSLTILLLFFALPGIAYSLVSPGALSMALQAVNNKDRGVVSGIFYTVSVVSGILGIATTSVVLHHYQQLGVQQALFHALPVVMMICLGLISLNFIMLLVSRNKNLTLQPLRQS